MSVKALKPLVFLVLVTAIVSLACQAISGSPEPTPIQNPPTQQPAPQEPTPQEVIEEEPTQQLESEGGGFVIFTDQNDLYSIEVPADWEYEQTYDAENNYYYIDTFSSPDGGAVIENIVYDDGTRFTGNQKGKFALYLLNTFYSSTGREGDIRVSDDKIMPDGSERLTWTSQGGGYSGISFLELRSNGTTFLLFTVDWGNSVEDEYIDTLNYVIESYSSP
ncbi:MAG: hypothetical protein PVJ21_12930 [Anaerolineales bacterium]|jgi:hypothetical protein